MRTYKILTGILLFILGAIFVNFYLVPKWQSEAAFQSFSNFGETMFPSDLGYTNANPAQSTYTFNTSSGQMWAAVLQVPNTGTIAKVGFNITSVTASTTVLVQLESVSASSGIPMRTPVVAGASTTVLINRADYFTVALPVSYNATRGEILAITITTNTTATTTPNFIVMEGITNFAATSFPHTMKQATSGAAYTVSNLEPNASIEYSDGSYAHVPQVYPLLNSTSLTYSTTTAASVVGLLCNFPYPVSVSGGWANKSNLASSSLRLYDSDGSTVLVSTTISSGPINPVSSSNRFPGEFLFNNSVSLKANKNYRLAIFALSSVSDTLGTLVVTSSAMRGQLQGGLNCTQLTKATSSLSWVQVTTTTPMMGFILDGFDNAQNGGSVIIRGRSIVK